MPIFLFKCSQIEPASHAFARLISKTQTRRARVGLRLPLTTRPSGDYYNSTSQQSDNFQQQTLTESFFRSFVLTTLVIACPLRRCPFAVASRKDFGINKELGTTIL